MAFWCITLSIIVLRMWWKHQYPKRPKEEPTPKFTPVTNSIKLNEAIKQKSELEKQREKDIAELKKQGYTDELIAIVLPTIENGG